MKRNMVKISHVFEKRIIINYKRGINDNQLHTLKQRQQRLIIPAILLGFLTGFDWVYFHPSLWTTG